MLTVYAKSHSKHGTVELVEHDDGRVGVWDPDGQQWLDVYGNGTSHAGFVRAILDGSFPLLTQEGKDWIERRKASIQ